MHMQVLGHTKTILVLLASWWVFHEPMVPRKLLGMGLAVVGMTAYGHAAMRRSNASKAAKVVKEKSEADVFARVLVPAGREAGKQSDPAPAAHPIRVSGSSERSSGDDEGIGDGITPGLQRRARARQLA
jgi:hypothetical protein